MSEKEKPPLKVRALLQRGDQREADGMRIPKEVLEDAIKTAPMNTMFVTKGYGRSVEDVVGIPTKLEMEGSDLFLEASITDEVISQLLKSGNMGFGISGTIHEKHTEGDTEVIDKMDIRSVGIFPKEKLMQPEFECEVCRSFAENSTNCYPTPEMRHHPDCHVCTNEESKQ